MRQTSKIVCTRAVHFRNVVEENEAIMISTCECAGLYNIGAIFLDGPNVRYTAKSQAVTQWRSH